MENQSQNPELRNNSENFHPFNKLISTVILAGQEYKQVAQWATIAHLGASIMLKGR